ncbi:MAG: hypothetical protein ACPIA1_02770 [Flavobacteriaceae bacterium]
MEDLRKNYDFWENKTYEETFVNNNKELILDLMGADEYFDISSSFLDKDAGIDGIAKMGKDNIGIALRIRKPQYNKWRYNFTLGHHFDKDNSQVHAILNALRPNVISPNFILQINGVNEEGYCEDCTAIKIQTDVFAELIQKRQQDNTLDEYYIPRLASYEFTMNDVFYETNSGVDYYLIENDTIINKASNDDN